MYARSLAPEMTGVYETTIFVVCVCITIVGLSHAVGKIGAFVIRRNANREANKDPYRVRVEHDRLVRKINWNDPKVQMQLETLRRVMRETRKPR